MNLSKFCAVNFCAMNQTHYLCPECQKWRQQITLIEFTPSEARKPTKTRLGRDTFGRWSSKNGWSRGPRSQASKAKNTHTTMQTHTHTRDAEEMLLRDTRNCNRHSHSHECIHNWTPWLPKLLLFLLLLFLLLLFLFLLLLLFLSLL